METTRYVVGYDGTTSAQNALKMATAMARAFEAELEIVLVLREDNPYQRVYPPVSDISPVLEAQARVWLEEALAVVEGAAGDAADGAVTARTHLWRSHSVVTGLLEAIDQLGAAMIAISAGSGKGRLSVGSVADALLHSSSVPVALAPRNYRPQVPPDRIYAAVGTRPGAQQVIREAHEVADRTGLPLEVISFLTDDDGARDAAVVESVREHVGKTVRDVTETDTEVNVASGASLKKAVATVDWQPGGVLLIGSSRLAQGRQLFLGTTAARLLRHLPVPMVVVPRPGATETGSAGLLGG